MNELTLLQTTLARALCKELGGAVYVTYLVHDDYYKGQGMQE